MPGRAIIDGRNVARRVNMDGPAVRGSRHSRVPVLSQRLVQAGSLAEAVMVSTYGVL
jgi:hypothetical protein